MTDTRKLWITIRTVEGERPKTVLRGKGPGAYDRRGELKAQGFTFGYPYDCFLSVKKEIGGEEKITQDQLDERLGKQYKNWNMTLDGSPADNGGKINAICAALQIPCPEIEGYDPNAPKVDTQDNPEDGEELPF